MYLKDADDVETFIDETVSWAERTNARSDTACGDGGVELFRVLDG